MNPDGSVIGIREKRLTVSECPNELRPFMIELSVIGKQAKSMDEEDNQYAMKLAQQGRSDDIPLSRLDRVRLVWEKGVGYDHDHDDGGVVDEVWKVVGFRLLIKLMLLDLL